MIDLLIDPRCPWVTVQKRDTVPRWELVGFVYQNENESGGRHNIYITVTDENGAPLSGINVTQGWPDGTTTQTTISGTTDFGIYGGPFYPDRGQAGAYSVYVENQMQSDIVMGMGLPVNRHVNYLLVFRKITDVPPTPPIPTDLEGRVTRLETMFREIGAVIGRAVA